MSNLKAAVVIDLQGNLPAEASRFQRSISDMSTAGSRRLHAMGRGVATLSNQIDRLGNRAVVGLGGMAYLFKRTFVGTAAEFERFQTVLETIEGSSAKAASSMQWVSDFAAKTPYELAQTTDAFIKLRAYGMDPMNGLLTTLGDTAAAMGKPLGQAVEAIADAVTGENERLKEFGIRARVAGKRIVYEYSHNGQTMRKTARANSREQIQATLQAIWNEKYAGAMDRLSNTYDGLMSNLSDQWTRFQNMVMKEGALDFIKDEIRGVLDQLEVLDKSGKLDERAKLISRDLVTALKSATEAGKGLWEVMKLVGQAAKFVADQVGGFENLGKALAAIYIANKALRMPVVTGTGKAIGGIAGAVLGRGKKNAPGSTGNPLLDAASRMAPVPVYVVNGPGGLADMAKGGFKRTKGVIKPSTAKLLGKAPIGALPALGGGAMALAAGGVAAAGLVGYGAGTLASKAMEGTRLGDAIGRGIAKALAAMGNENAKAAVEAERKYLAEQPTAKIEIELKGEGSRRAQVRNARADGLDVVTTGRVMGTR